MKRITSGVVELTCTERAASDYRERLLDRGVSIPDAVDKVVRVYHDLDPEFIDYLSQ